MKNIVFVFLGILLSIYALALALNIHQVPGTSCLELTMPARAQIYSESNSATNRVATVHAKDVVYFCGDEE